MDKNSVLTTSSWLLILLGIVMIYLGAFFAPKIMYPPIVSGIGFFVIAWAFKGLKE